MGLVAQWDRLVGQLPDDWRELDVMLLVARPDDAARAATLLGSLSPGIVGDELHLRVTSGGEAGPGVVRRALARLDEQEIIGTLELAAPVTHLRPKPKADRRATLRSANLRGLAQVTRGRLGRARRRPAGGLERPAVRRRAALDRRADPAALAFAPLNPSRHKGSLAFRFRVARHLGYGAAPQMARRCLERADGLGIPGELRLLEALSETRHVLTQGPTFVVSDQGGLMLGLAERVQEIQARARTLARLQLELATLELKRKGKALAIAAALAIVALVCVLYAVGFVFAAAAAGLTEVVPLWGALLIVSLLLLLTALVLVFVAMRFARKAGPRPVETIEEAQKTARELRDA